MIDNETTNYILIGESPLGYTLLDGSRHSVANVEQVINGTVYWQCSISGFPFNLDPEIIFGENYFLQYADYPDQRIDADTCHDLRYNGRRLPRYGYPQAILMHQLKLREN